MPSTSTLTEPKAGASQTADIVERIEAQLRLQRMAGAETPSTVDPLREVRARQWVNPHLPIGWPQMPRGLVPKIVALLQKVCRRLLRWYINPLVAQQNEFNEAVVAALQDAYRYVDRELAAAEGRRQELELAVRRLAAQAPWAGEAVQPQRTAPLAPLRLLAKPATLSLPVSRFDAVIRRLLLAEQLAPQDAPLPLLFLGEDGPRLVDHARDLGVAAYTLSEPGQLAPADGDAVVLAEGIPEHLSALPAYSLGGLVWADGLWRHTPDECLQLLTSATSALAAGAPVVVASVEASDYDALSRYVWADPAAVRPYPHELAAELLKAAGLNEVADLASPWPPEGPSGWYALCGYAGDL
ncbi:MAG: hypothetical protein ABFD20_06400 [Anaerolineales bacterium]